LIYTNETPIYFGYPNLGYIKQDDIVDVLGKDEIATLKELGFDKAPPFEGEPTEEIPTEPVTEEEVNNG